MTRDLLKQHQKTPVETLTASNVKSVKSFSYGVVVPGWPQTKASSRTTSVQMVEVW